MKAAFIESFGGSEVLKIGDLPEPKVSDGEVLVRVRYSALNHLDIWVRRGLPFLKLPLPHILGCDAAGLVERVGAGVSHVKEGDEVIVHPGLTDLFSPPALLGNESLCSSYRILGEHVHGTNAEQVAVPAANVFPKPTTLDWEAAASVGLVFTTAYQMVFHCAQVKPGDWVLVHAAGSGVSSAAIQLLKLVGAQVIATAGTSEKRAKALDIGADVAIDYTQPEWIEKVREVTKRLGVDTILDHVGASVWEGNIRCIKWGGSIVTCGATSGPVVSTDLRHIFYRQIQLKGSTMGSKGDFPRILNLLSSGSCRPVIDTCFPLDEIVSAHERIESRAQFGKVLLRVS